MEAAAANRFINLLKNATDKGSTDAAAASFLSGVRKLMLAANVTLDDVLAVAMNDRLPEIQAAMLDEMESLRLQAAQQGEMIKALQAEKTMLSAQFTQAAIAMKMLPHTAEAGAALLDADEMAAMNAEVETSIRRVRAMHSGGDFALFEDFVIERLGIAPGWQSLFCSATGVPRWQIQNFRMRNFVPAEMFVIAGNFVPVAPKPKILWSDEMYAYLGDLITVSEQNDDAHLARLMQERFEIEISVSAVTAAKNRVKRKRATAEAAAKAAAKAAREAEARAANDRLSRRAAREAEMESERQRVEAQAAREREARARAQAESDAAWEEAVMPPQETLYDRWKRGIFA